LRLLSSGLYDDRSSALASSGLVRKAIMMDTRGKPITPSFHFSG